MDRVADAAGVAKGTLYLYFPSKDALYLGVLSDGLDTAYRTYQSSADPKLPVVERLRHSIGVMVEFYDRRRDRLQFLRDRGTAAGRARDGIIEGSRERGFNFFASLIEEGFAPAFRAGRSSPGNLHHPGRDSLAAAFYGTSHPVSELSRELGNLMFDRSAQVRRSTSGRYSHNHPNRRSAGDWAGNPGRTSLRILPLRPYLFVAA